MIVLHRHSRSSGSPAFTLVELSLGMALISGLGVALLLMLNLHVSFVGMVISQDFLLRDAPRVGGLLTRMLNQADHFFIFSDAAAADDPAALPVETGAAVKLFFRRPEGGSVMRTLVFEPGSADGAVPGTLRVASAENPQGWPLSRAVRGATFLVEDGLLKVRLQGPRGEELTYAGGGS
jgi:hypothetical protein